MADAVPWTPRTGGRERAPGTVTAIRVGVLALQGDVREHLSAFSRCGAAVTPVRLASELAGVDALAFPGGESTAISRLLRDGDLEEPLRRRVEGGMPCFATCAGLILLAREIVDGRPDQAALGTLDISVRRNGYGRQLQSFETDLEVAGLPGGDFRGVFIRAPVIEGAGPRAEVLAGHGEHPVAIAQGPSIALAFHPEMTGDDRLHRLFLERVAGRAVGTAA